MQGFLAELQIIISNIEYIRSDVELFQIQQEGTEDADDLLDASNFLGDAIDAISKVIDRKGA